MSNAEYDTSVFAVGGAVQAAGGIYLTRAADEELLALCRAGDFGYVLTTRQLGKSSLMVRTAERLAGEGVRSAIIDLTEIGVGVTPEVWFLGLLVKIEDQFALETSALSWWAGREHQSPAQRLTAYFQQVLLKEVKERVVIFVDEIDTTLGLSFTDDFYAAIRYFYNARSHVPEFRRLSFVLIGVATPGDLIRDPRRTPFNIGRRVDLTDFTYDEALPLAAGFQLAENEARRVLRWILGWTGGHPYLTQRLCRAIADERRTGWSEEDVARVVSATFFGEMSEKDNNTQFVRDMLLKRAPDLAEVLTTYREILRRPVRDEEQSVVKSHLKLSGVVRREGTSLRVRNPIYREVFNRHWVRSHLPINWPRRLTRVAAGLIIALMVLAIPLAVYAWSKKTEAESNAAIARSNEATARLALEQAHAAREQAERSERAARASGRQAEEARGEALWQKEAAERARAEATEQARLAQASARAAQAARGEALGQKVQAEHLSEIVLKDDLAVQARARHIGSVSLLNDSVILARESISQPPKGSSLIAYQVLSNGLMLLPRRVAAPRMAGGRILHASFIAEGKRVLTIASGAARARGRSSMVRVFDSADGQEVDSLRRAFDNIAVDQRRRYLAALDAGGTVSVMDLVGGAVRGTFNLGPSEPSELPEGSPVSSDGRHVAFVGPDGVRVKSLDGVDDGPALPTLLPSGEVLKSVYLGPDGKQIVLVSEDPFKNESSGVAEVFEVASGRKLSPTLDSKSHPQSEVSGRVQYSSDGRYLAIVGAGSLAVYATDYFAGPAWSIDVTEGSPAHVIFSPSSQSVAVTTPDTVRLLSTLDGAARFILPAREEQAEAVGFSQDEKTIAVRYNGNTVRVFRWDAGTPREVARVIREADVTYFDLSPDGRYLLTVDAEQLAGDHSQMYMRVPGQPVGQLNVWDLRPEKDFVRRTLAESVDTATLSPDRKRILVTSNMDGETQRWKISLDSDGPPDAKLLKAHKTVTPSHDAGDAFSFDASRMVEIEASDGTEANTRVRVTDLAGGGSKETRVNEELTYPASVSSDGKYFAATQTAAGQTSVLVYEAATGRVVASVADETGDRPSTIAFSPDGRYLATGSQSGGGLVWDLKEARAAARFEQRGVESQILFSVSGKYAVSVSNEVRLWRRGESQPVTLAPESTIASRMGGGVEQGFAFEPRARRAARADVSYDARGVAFFSADERYVAAGGSDNVARVWETATGRPLTFGHDSQVVNVALSAGGEYLATLSRDGFLRVWDVESQTLVALLPRFTPPYEKTDVAFSYDGKFLLTSHNHAGGAVQMWLWRPEDLLALTCTLLPVGDPTPSLWRLYLGDELANYLLAKSHDHCPSAR